MSRLLSTALPVLLMALACSAGEEAPLTPVEPAPVISAPEERDFVPASPVRTGAEPAVADAAEEEADREAAVRSEAGAAEGIVPAAEAEQVAADQPTDGVDVVEPVVEVPVVGEREGGLGVEPALTEPAPGELAAVVPEEFVETLTLDGSKRFAVDNSLELQKREIAVASQKLSTLIERSAFDWRLSGEVSRSNTVPRDDDDDGSNSTTGSVTLRRTFAATGIDFSATGSATDAWQDPEDNSASMSVQLSRVILGGGSVFATRYALETSMIDEIVTLNTAHRFRRELLYRVTSMYYRIIRDLQTLRIRELQLERARKNLEHAIERERPLDIATAQIEVPENEVSVLRAKITIQSSLDELKDLIGMEIAKPVEIDPSFDFEEAVIDVAADIAAADDRDELIINSLLQLKKAQRDVRLQRERVWPQVSVFARSSRDSFEGYNLDGDTDHRAGLSVEWDIGRRADLARWERSKNSLRQAELDLAILRIEKEKELRRLARRLDESLRLIRLQEDRIVIATRRVALYADRWENGEIDILEYIRSQNDLENARVELINLKTSYMDLLGEYRLAAGLE